MTERKRLNEIIKKEIAFICLPRNVKKTFISYWSEKFVKTTKNPYNNKKLEGFVFIFSLKKLR